MDKAYKGDIPRHKRTLADLKREFSRLAASTDWTRLRIEPLLKHVSALERLLHSTRFSGENTRLRKGVAMFHADLVYLRTNIRVLKDILAAEKQRAQGPKNSRRSNQVRHPARRRGVSSAEPGLADG